MIKDFEDTLPPVRLTLSLPHSLHQEVKAMADQVGVTPTSLIRAILINDILDRKLKSK